MFYMSDLLSLIQKNNTRDPNQNSLSGLEAHAKSYLFSEIILMQNRHERKSKRPYLRKNFLGYLFGNVVGRKIRPDDEMPVREAIGLFAFVE